MAQLLLFFSLQAVSCYSYSVTVFAGDEFIFPVPCGRNGSGKLVRHMGSTPDRHVADLQDGVWKPTEQYRDRIRENSSTIVFISAFYTDSSEGYELSCGEKPMKRVRLKVLVPYEVTGSVGQTVALPCFSNTLENSASSVLWQKNGTDLCVQNSGSDGCNGTDDRLSVSSSWSSHGDLSLTIRGVRPEDQGDYFCFIKDKSNKESGSPAGVRLKVTEEDHQQTQKNCADQIVLAVITFITTVMFGFVAASILVYHRCYRSASSRNAAAVSSREMDPLQNHHPSQANGGTLNV